MKTSTIHPPSTTICSLLAADTSFFDGSSNRQTFSFSHNLNKLQTRNLNTVRLPKGLPLLTRIINSVSYNHSVPILFFNKFVCPLRDFKDPCSLWSIRILHKSRFFFNSSQTPNELNCCIGSFLRNIVSHYLTMYQVSTGHLLFRKAPKNPT